MMPPGYTLIPQAVWVVAPVAFYVCFLWLVERFPERKGLILD